MTKTAEHRVGEDTNFQVLPVLRYHEEQRDYPRVDLRVPVALSTRERRVIHATTRNISPGGMQIRCDRAAAQRLHPSGSHIAPGKGPPVIVRTKLPVCEGEQPFVGVARLTYVTPRPPDQIAFGLEFTRVQPSEQDKLDAFFSHVMCPAE